MRKLSLVVSTALLGLILLSSVAFAGSIADQWASTKHNAANLGEITKDSPIMRDNCIVCHDGEGFANNVAKRAELPKDVQATPNGVDCSTCHGDRAAELMASGNTGVLANGYQVQGAGSGALCITCHNGRKLPDPVKTPAPHSSAQFDVLFAAVGAKIPSEVYPSSPHGANPDTCVSCHMAQYDGVVNHTFKVVDTPEYVKAACASCHPGLDTVNRTALGDYDGDKVVEGIQDEVKGLVELLKAAVAAKEEELGLHGGYSHGALHWTDKSGADVKPPVAIYNAHFNITLIEDDASYGIHNPAYTVSLLQKSYKELTGQDVPNALLR